MFLNESIRKCFEKEQYSSSFQKLMSNALKSITRSNTCRVENKRCFSFDFHAHSKRKLPFLERQTSRKLRNNQNSNKIEKLNILPKLMFSEEKKERFTFCRKSITQGNPEVIPTLDGSLLEFFKDTPENSNIFHKIKDVPKYRKSHSLQKTTPFLANTRIDWSLEPWNSCSDSC